MNGLRSCLSDIRRVALCLSFAAATFLLPSFALAGTQAGPDYVVNALTDTDDGSCDQPGTGTGNQDCTLREAINAASGYGDTAIVRFGVSGTITLAGTLPQLSHAITIDGADQSVTISGNNGNFRAFELMSGSTSGPRTIKFNALTITQSSPAIYVFSRSFEITNCTFDSNGGGGIFAGRIGPSIIANSTFVNNSSSAVWGFEPTGGAGPLTVTNSTFYGNNASSNNGSAVQMNRTNATFRNCIFAASLNGRNCAQVASAVFDANNSNFSTDGTCGGATQATTAQLKLDALQNYGGPTKTMALLASSVAINAGDNAVCNAAPVHNQDQRGYDRIRLGDASCDAGAYEAGATGSLQVNSVADTASSADRQTSLREALAHAQSLGGAQTVTFSPALGGRTVTLNTGWDNASDEQALRITGQITLQGVTSAPGVAIAVAPGVQKRHLYVAPGGNLTVSHLTFTGGNGPSYGGSIWSQGSLTVRNCTFTGNTAGHQGGAIQSWGGSPLLAIENSTFTGNTSHFGAGAINGGATSMSFRYVTIAHNSGSHGNAVEIVGNQLTMINSIIAGESEGVATANGGTFSAQSTNNLLTAASAPGLTNGMNNNQLGIAIAQLDLGPLEDYGGPTRTIRLGSNSIAVDGGADIAGVSIDQRGTTRPQLHAPDVGAFELEPGAGSLVVTTTADEENGTSDPWFGSGTSLREALLYAETLGGPQTITFAPALAGQIVTLSKPWSNVDSYRSRSALTIENGQNITIEGTADAPGVTLKIADAAQLRHFAIAGNGSLTLVNLTLTGGSATLANFSFGGSIWNFGYLTVRNCTFTGNTAGAEGGAIQSWGESPSLLIENSTFAGNHSDGIGGAIDSGAVSMALRHVTITNNTATNGHALVIYKYPLTMVNSLIAGNGSDSVLSASGGTFSGASTKNILSSATAPGLTNGVNENQLGMPVNQLWLTPLANNGGPTPTIALQPGSLAIDAGALIEGLTSDQRGIQRPQQGVADVGAFELVQVQAAAPIINPTDGAYEHSVQISMMTTSSPNASIRYTAGCEAFDDFCDPSPTSGELYTGPFSITTTRSVKAIAYGRGWIPSPMSFAYFDINEPLDYWRNMHAGLGHDGSDGDTANPSGDGVVNILKYAFNLAPNAGDLLRSNNQVLAPNATAGLPSVTADGQGRLVLQFVRRKASTNPGVTYIPESSTDLLTWTPITLTNATVVSINAVWERVTVVDPVVSAQRFGRVAVTTLGTYYNDFDLGSATSFTVGSARFKDGAVELTDGLTGGQLGNLVLEDVDLGEAPPSGTELTGFTARFMMKLGPSATGTPGDGLSFAVGYLPKGNPLADPPEPRPGWGETGPGTSDSLAIGFDTFDNGGAGSIGIHVWVNGVHVAASPVNPYTNGALVPVEITWEDNSALTVKFNGTIIFDRLPITGFRLRGDAPDSNDHEFGFGARTGGAVQQAVVDNVQIEPRF